MTEFKDFIAYTTVAFVRASSLEEAKAAVPEGVADMVILPEDWVRPTDPADRVKLRIKDGAVVLPS